MYYIISIILKVLYYIKSVLCCQGDFSRIFNICKSIIAKLVPFYHLTYFTSNWDILSHLIFHKCHSSKMYHCHILKSYRSLFSSL